jgi:hypothetical protein
MASKTRSNSTSPETGNAMTAPMTPMDYLADLPRKQLALMTQSASALFRGSEAMRKIQQQAAHRAAAHQDEVTERLRAPCDFSELLAIQGELLRFNLQEAAQYWQQLTDAALKVQADVVSRVAEDAQAEPTLDSLQRAFQASLAAGTASTAAH